MCGGWKARIVRLFYTICILVGAAQIAPADIFEWEYVDPANPAQGKRASTILVPDGAGAVAGPDARLGNRNLTKAYFAGANLIDGEFFNTKLVNADLAHATFADVYANRADLSGADLTGADLSRTDFQNAILTDAKLQSAIITGTSFQQAVGFTSAQLYSTVNYQEHDLRDVIFRQNDLRGWDFSNQVLHRTDFRETNLTNANFAGADIREADYSSPLPTGRLTLAQVQSTASYATKDLSQTKFSQYDFAGANFAGFELQRTQFLNVSLIGANLSEANLSNANLGNANLTGTNLRGADLRGASVSSRLQNADFSESDVRGTQFSASGTPDLSATQLYSTASYQDGDLTGIRLGDAHDLSGWDFSGKNLTRAILGSTLNSVNFQASDLTEASLGGTFTNANFSDAIIRGARFSQFSGSLGTTISKEQLYSTASYKNGDLAGVSLFFQDLAGWDFSGKNLAGAVLRLTNLSNANLSNANLTNANLDEADLLGANLSGAIVNGADLTRITLGGLTATQFYTTASYQNRNLTGISWHASNLSGWDFSDQDLTDNSFLSTSLTDTDFTGAIINRARFELIQPNTFSAAQLYSTASYQNHDLRGVTLHYVGFSSLDLTFLDLTDADLALPWAVTDLAGATIRNTQFRMFDGFPVLTGDQISSTASYQTGDMTGLRVEGWNVTLTDWNLAGKDLTGAAFYGHFEAGGLTLSQFNFDHANLADVEFYYAWFVNSSFVGADVRGTGLLNRHTGPASQNMIQSSGVVDGVDLTNNELLIVRDYDGPSKIEILVDKQFETDHTSVVRMLFDGDEWGSLISFGAGIHVSLSGMLELEFAPGTNVAAQVGRSFKVFDWTGVDPSGTFQIESPYQWNTSQLYSSGSITLLAVPEPSTGAWMLTVVMAVVSVRRTPRG